MSAESTGTREVAHRIFAVEYADSTYEYRAGEDERSPKYVLSPTGAAINRLFVVGVLTMVEWVNEETIRARIVDPTGAFVIYAGQYQPDERSTLDELDTPTFVAVTGKANTFQPTDSDEIYTSIRPEAVAEVDAITRDRWVVTTAERTMDRIQKLQHDDEGNSTAGNRGKDTALEIYAPTDDYLDLLYTVCIDTLRLVAGEIETVSIPTLNMSTQPQRGDTADGQGEIEISPESEDSEKDDQELVQSDRDDSEQLDEFEDVLSDSERATIEEEYGTEFTTGNDIPQAEEDISATANQSENPTVESVIGAIEQLDDGEGVTKETIIEFVSKSSEATEETVTALLQQALMQGKCYESEEDIYRPI